MRAISVPPGRYPTLETTRCRPLTSSRRAPAPVAAWTLCSLAGAFFGCMGTMKEPPEEDGCKCPCSKMVSRGGALFFPYRGGSDFHTNARPITPSNTNPYQEPVSKEAPATTAVVVGQEPSPTKVQPVVSPPV